MPVGIPNPYANMTQPLGPSLADRIKAAVGRQQAGTPYNAEEEAARARERGWQDVPGAMPTYAGVKGVEGGVPQIPMTTAPNAPDPENPTIPNIPVTGEFPFGPDRPGESRMYKGSITPLQDVSTHILKALGNIPDFAGTTSQIMGLAPQIQGLFQPDASTQGQLFQNIMGMLRPQQEEQTRALSNQLAAMGMGGGRAGRALAQQQRGFGEQATDITNQLLQQQLAGQQTAGQILSNLLGQQLGAGQALQTNLLSMLPGLGIAESQLAPTILDVFQNRGV